MQFVYTVFPNRDEAMQIGRSAVQEHLAACFNAFPIESAYWWDGEVVENQEIGVLFKTLSRRRTDLMKFIKNNHSYETPCIVAWEAEHVDPTYREWIQRNVT